MRAEQAEKVLPSEGINDEQMRGGRRPMMYRDPLAGHFNFLQRAG